MPFEPQVHQTLKIEGQTCRIAEHPAAPGMPYGQEGRQAVVYQLVSGSDRKALKVFKPRFRLPALVTLTGKLLPFAQLPGLQACQRAVMSALRHTELLRQYPDLTYAVLMPWIEGPTWMEVLVTGRTLSASQSLHLARSLAVALTSMEEQGAAHCDLSGPNLLLPALTETATDAPFAVELVDVEQLYGAGLTRPQLLTSGSVGYAHRTAVEGLWSGEADRFAGAVLLAEMLGWCDPRVRAAAWGESYFDPEEIQRLCKRYELLTSILEERWGETVASSFRKAWYSEQLGDCPTFGEWFVSLPAEVAALSPGQFDGVRVEVSRLRAERDIPALPDTAPVAEEDVSAATPSASQLGQMERQALALEQAEQWAEAAGIYDQLLSALLSYEQRTAWQRARDRCQEEAVAARPLDSVLVVHRLETPGPPHAAANVEQLQVGMGEPGLPPSALDGEPQPTSRGPAALARKDAAWRGTPRRRFALAGALAAVLLVAIGLSLQGFRPPPVPQSHESAHDTTTNVSSPAGGMLFTSTRDGGRRAYRLLLDGTVEPLLDPSASSENWGAIPAEGTVYFTSLHNGKRQAFRLLSDGSVQQMTTAPEGESWGAAPVEGSIYFTSTRSGQREIYRLVSGGVEQMTYTVAGESWGAAEADSTVYFTSTRSGRREVFRFVTGGGVEQMTYTHNGESWGAQAAQGTVYFTSTRDGRREIYRFARGSVPERMTYSPGESESWAPMAAEGTIHFTSDRDGQREVYRFAPGGTVERMTYTSGGESWLDTDGEE